MVCMRVRGLRPLTRRKSSGRIGVAHNAQMCGMRYVWRIFLRNSTGTLGVMRRVYIWTLSHYKIEYHSSKTYVMDDKVLMVDNPPISWPSHCRCAEISDFGFTHQLECDGCEYIARGWAIFTLCHVCNNRMACGKRTRRGQKCYTCKCIELQNGSTQT